MDAKEWLNNKVKSLNKANTFYGYVRNVYHDQFEKEFPEWMKEYATHSAQERYERAMELFKRRASDRPHPAVVEKWIELASGIDEHKK